jgi:hypothetical protein
MHAGNTYPVGAWTSPGLVLVEEPHLGNGYRRNRRGWQAEAKEVGTVSDDKAGEQGLDGEVEHALRQLTLREREIVRLRFGIGDRVHGRAEVSARFGVTQARVRQIEACALRKLRATAFDDLCGDFEDEGAPTGDGNEPCLGARGPVIKTPTQGIPARKQEDHGTGGTGVSGDRGSALPPVWSPGPPPPPRPEPAETTWDEA